MIVLVTGPTLEASLIVPALTRRPLPACLLAATVLALGSSAAAQECQSWQARHPEWIFCDDFQTHDPLVASGRYFEVVDDEGDLAVVDGLGVGDSRGLRIRWQAGEVGAGNLKLGFGRNPSGYMNTGIRPDEDFRDIYYRTYLRMQAGWQGNPNKLSRATVIAASDWSQAMIAHLWEGSGEFLGIDPVRCVDASNQVVCRGYNDFAHMTWLGAQSGITPVFAPGFDDRWFCIEAHVRLNDPGQNNGIQEFWIDGQVEARSEGLDFVGAYTDYAINAIFFENWKNAGSPREQERYFDSIVVSTAPIGCLAIFSDGFESGDVSLWSQ